jgi:hypothetical protein
MYVAADNVDYQVFLARECLPTRIRNEVELQEVLLKQYPAGAMTRKFVPREIIAAMEIVDKARVRAAFSIDEIEGRAGVDNSDTRVGNLASAIGLTMGVLK